MDGEGRDRQIFGSAFECLVSGIFGPARLARSALFSKPSRALIDRCGDAWGLGWRDKLMDELRVERENAPRCGGRRCVARLRRGGKHRPPSLRRPAPEEPVDLLGFGSLI